MKFLILNAYDPRSSSFTRESGTQVRLYRRPGNDLTSRFPLIVGTLARSL